MNENFLNLSDKNKNVILVPIIDLNDNKVKTWRVNKTLWNDIKKIGESIEPFELADTIISIQRNKIKWYNKVINWIKINIFKIKIKKSIENGNYTLYLNKK